MIWRLNLPSLTPSRRDDGRAQQRQTAPPERPSTPAQGALAPRSSPLRQLAGSALNLLRGATPGSDLRETVRTRDYASMRQLMQTGADPNSASRGGRTALDIANQLQDAQAIGILQHQDNGTDRASIVSRDDGDSKGKAVLRTSLESLRARAAERMEEVASKIPGFGMLSFPIQEEKGAQPHDDITPQPRHLVEPTAPMLPDTIEGSSTSQPAVGGDDGDSAKRDLELQAQRQDWGYDLEPTVPSWDQVAMQPQFEAFSHRHSDEEPQSFHSPESWRDSGRPQTPLMTLTGPSEESLIGADAPPTYADSIISSASESRQSLGLTDGDISILDAVAAEQAGLTCLPTYAQSIHASDASEASAPPLTASPVGPSGRLRRWWAGSAMCFARAKAATCAARCAKVTTPG